MTIQDWIASYRNYRRLLCNHPVPAQKMHEAQSVVLFYMQEGRLPKWAVGVRP